MSRVKVGWGCVFSGLLVLLPAGGAAAEDTADAARPLTIVVVGDTGLNRTMQPVVSRGGYKHGRLIPWDRMLDGIRAEIDGDLNVLNLETVVTARNDLRPEAKTFRFRSHPEGVRQLVRQGFNLFSLANNHSMDFGAEGARETIKAVEEMKADGLLAHAGLGLTYEDAAKAHVVAVRGTRIAFAAIGITTQGFPHHRAGPDRPGQLSYRSDEDFAEVVRRLKDAQADYRILSVHYGPELSVSPDNYDRDRLRRRAVQEAGIDLVLGHHAHVAAGIETVDGRAVFYGLGNFLHWGTQDMRKFGPCRDWGLMARLRLMRADGGRLTLRAIEAIPLAGMHDHVARHKEAEARKRIAVLNSLSAGLGNAKAGGEDVRFAVRPDGTGVYCPPGFVPPAADLMRGRSGSAADGSIEAVCAAAAAQTAVRAAGNVSCGPIAFHRSDPEAASRRARSRVAPYRPGVRPRVARKRRSSPASGETAGWEW
ncbi:MAG: CapA family protein [Hyphomicrobiaceae bacterium]